MPESMKMQAPMEGVDFESLPWNMNLSEHANMVVCKIPGGVDAKFGPESYDPATDSGSATQAIKYGAIQNANPAMTSLNYGTTVWEGIKSFRTKSGRVVIFRPNKNWQRMANGAERMCLAVPSYELFMRGCQTAVLNNLTMVPPCGDGMKLYIRPILFGSGQQLGLYPSPEMSLIFYTAPTGNYFKGATAGLKLNIEKRFCRAARGGVGAVKCAGNYAVALKPLQKAKDAGFADNIYLELDSYLGPLESGTDEKTAFDNAILQEMSAANVFVVQKSKSRILTPSLDRKTILPGVTRDSVIEIIKKYNSEIQAALGVTTEVTVEETDVKVKELKDASEVFATGTAAELVPIQSFGTYDDSGKAEPYVQMQSDQSGPVTTCILKILREIMTEARPDEFGWLYDVAQDAKAFRRE